MRWKERWGDVERKDVDGCMVGRLIGSIVLRVDGRRVGAGLSEVINGATVSEMCGWTRLCLDRERDGWREGQMDP